MAMIEQPGAKRQVCSAYLRSFGRMSGVIFRNPDNNP
jgi:hypothetical protein